jgi:hypothetical protein
MALSGYIISPLQKRKEYIAVHSGFDDLNFGCGLQRNKDHSIRWVKGQSVPRHEMYDHTNPTLLVACNGIILLM